MAKNFAIMLEDWTREMPKTEKTSLREQHCEILASLRFVRLDLNFLHAAIKFWNPNLDVFRFHNNEITPFPEELGAIVNWPFDCLPCTPNLTEY